MLAAPTTALIIREIAAGGPKSPSDIAGEPGSETLFDLTEAGREQIFVLAVLERWLEGGLAGEGPPDDRVWESLAGALADSWANGILHALAAAPRSLPELDRAVTSLGRPALERRVKRMVTAGLLEPSDEEDDDETTYEPTPWLCRAMGPLLAATRSEGRHPLDATAPIAASDVAAVFALTLRLVGLGDGLSGSCSLEAKLPRPAQPALTGAYAAFDGGQLADFHPGLEGGADAAARGSLDAWFTALIDGDAGALELHGDSRVACGVVERMHAELFPQPA